MRTLIICVLALAACQSPVATPDPAARPAPHQLGRLGRPMGTWLHLEGVRETSGKVGPHSFAVDRIDGTPLAAPIAVNLANLELPQGERCAVAGYETGRWIGIPPDVLAREQMPPTQAGWQFVHEFVVTSAQAPDELVRTARERGIGRR